MFSRLFQKSFCLYTISATCCLTTTAAGYLYDDASFAAFTASQKNRPLHYKKKFLGNKILTNVNIKMQLDPENLKKRGVAKDLFACMYVLVCMIVNDCQLLWQQQCNMLRHVLGNRGQQVPYEHNNLPLAVD